MGTILDVSRPLSDHGLAPTDEGGREVPIGGRVGPRLKKVELKSTVSILRRHIEYRPRLTGTQPSDRTGETRARARQRGEHLAARPTGRHVFGGAGASSCC